MSAEGVTNAGMAKVRASKAVIAVPNSGQVVFYNFLLRKAAFCSTDALYWFTYLNEWTAFDKIVDDHPHLEGQTIREELGKLVEIGLLNRENAKNTEFENQYIENWEWGLAAAIFHFSVQNGQFMNPAEAAKMQADKAKIKPSPELFWCNTQNSVTLPSRLDSPIEELLELMSCRRTNRTLASPKISLRQLSDCLYSGLGITGKVATPHGYLPLSMTPSGGARNPYEAFILARNVEGLAPGFYHYSAMEHTLALTKEGIPNSPAEYLAKQEWADEMPAIIFLVAVLERTMWKYPDPNAYRVLLIEAGHIGQNIMLAASAHGLSACPTAALNHDLISCALDLSNITHVPVYSLTLGVPGTYDAHIQMIN